VRSPGVWGQGGGWQSATQASHALPNGELNERISAKVLLLQWLDLLGASVCGAEVALLGAR